MDSYRSEDIDKLTPGEARFLKSLSKWFFRIGGTVLLLLFLIGSVFLVRLSFGPINLNFARPEILKAIQEAETGLDIQFSDVELVWERWVHPFEIVVKDVRITDSLDKGDTLKISEVGISLWLEHLVSGNLQIRNLFIYSPKLTLNRNPETGFMLHITSNTNGAGQSLTFEKMLPLLVLGQGQTRLGAFSNLNKVVISDSLVTLKDDVVGEVWNFPKMTVILNRYPDGFRVRARLKPQEKALFVGTLEAELKHRLGSSRIDMSLDFKKVNFAELLSSNKHLFDDDVKNETLIEEILEFLHGLDFPLKGRCSLAIVPKTGQFIEGGALLKAGAGSIKLNGTYLPVNELSIRADIDQSLIKIDRAQLYLGPAKFVAKGMHTSKGSPLFIHKWLESGSGITFSLTGSGINLDTLEHLWPKQAARAAREWVTEQIPEGLVPNLQVSFEGHVDEAEAFVVDKLEGEFDLEKATINYMKGLPHAREVEGAAHFDDTKIVIDVTDASVEDVTLSSGTVTIYDLDTDDEKLDLDLDLKGPLSDILFIIDHEPLGFAKKALLDPEKTRGEGSLNLKMSFPLLVDLKIEDVKLNVDGRVTGVATEVPAGDHMLDVQGGEIELKVDEQHLEGKGTAVIDQQPCVVKGMAYFNDDRPTPWEAQIQVDSVTTEADLKRLGYDYTEFIRGQSQTQVTFEYFEEHKSTLAVRLGMNQMRVHVPQIGWTKGPGEEASLSFLLHIGKGGFDRMENLELQSRYIQARGHGKFSTQHDLRTLSLTSITAPHTTASLTIHFLKNEGYDLRVSGQQVNAEPFMDYLENGDPEVERKASFPLSVTTSVDRLRMGEGREFRDVDAKIQVDVQPHEVNWLRVNLNAAAGRGTSKNGRMGGAAGGISFDLEPNGNGGQSLDIKANDAGQLFRNLELYDKVLKGTMTIKATRSPGQPFVGSFEIDNFDATDIPLAGQLASVLSPMGIINLVSGQDRLTIATFHCDFTYSDEELSFKEGVGKSIGLGFTTEGRIDRVNRSFNIKGNIIPAYVLNSIIDNIPIVGSLLTGGKGEGLFAVAYTVTGPIDHPNVEVNPLTALAPGFIRNLFEGL